MRLIKVFKSSLRIYECSKNKGKFCKILKENNIFLSNKILLSLTNFSVKEKAFNLYKLFLEYNISVVPINSKGYPKKLYNLDIPPICIFIYGDINILNTNIVYLYNSQFSKYGNKVYGDFIKYILSKNIKLIENNNGNKEASINIKIFKEFNLIEFKEYISNFSKDNVHIFLFNNYSDIYEYYMISALSKFILIIEASYGDFNKLNFIVDFFIEQGKDVLVTPGNIYNKYSYFSNYLIKQGANILLSKYDIDSYI